MKRREGEEWGSVGAGVIRDNDSGDQREGEKDTVADGQADENVDRSKKAVS